MTWLSFILIGDTSKVRTYFGKHNLKYLSTTNRYKIEAKGRDRLEADFYGKFILCSNNENNFIKIDANEIRFWVIKIPKLEFEDTELLEKLKVEIPCFLYFLKHRSLSVPEPLTRMWFTPEQIKTKALERLMCHDASKVEMLVLESMYELIQEIDDETVYLCPKDVVFLLERNKKYISAGDIRKILKQWGLQPEDNTKSYKGYHLSNGEYLLFDRRGRYYTVNRDLISEKFDALMQN